MRRIQFKTWMAGAVLPAAACFLLFPLRTRAAASLLAGRELEGVSFLYNAIENPTSGACPQLEAGQPELTELLAFPETAEVRWCGTAGSGMELPHYQLFFFDAAGMPQVTMQITSTGYLHCGHSVYRSLEPSAQTVWVELERFYAGAVSLQE